MSQRKSLPRIIELQTQLYTKQKEFTKGLRDKMPHDELKALNEEIKKLHQEILNIRTHEATVNNNSRNVLAMATVKLVFVDDDEDDRTLIREGLSSLQIDHATVLESGAALLTFLHKLGNDALPEAIILDLNMPKISGLDMLRILKSMEEYQTIPVYILTTASDSDMRDRCITEGAADYFTKPNTLVKLFALLNTINSTIMN